MDFAVKRCQVSNLQADIEAIGLEIDTFDEQLNDPCLLRRKKLIPELVKLQKRTTYVVLGDVLILLAGRAPSLDNDFGCLQKLADLVQDDALDLGRRHLPDGALGAAAFHRRLTGVVAIQLSRLPGMGW